MLDHWKNFVEVALFELNLCQNDFDSPIRSIKLGHVEILVFFGAWLL